MIPKFVAEVAAISHELRNRTTSRAQVLNTLETLAIGAAGGALFLWLHVPGGLTSGALVATGIASFAGRPLFVPPFLTQTVLVVLGIMLGSLVSWQLLQHIGAYPLTIALLALATFCVTAGSTWYLQHVHGWDRTSAFLASCPGAISQVAMLAVEKGADVPAIAVTQTFRVIILAAGLPLLLSVGGAGASPLLLGGAAASPLELAELAAAAAAVAWVLRLIHFPASWMFGAMIGSGVLHGFGWVEGGLPPWMWSAALVVVGALLGSRFARMKAGTLFRHLGAALGSFAITILVSSVFVAVVAAFTPLRLADIAVAFAPGSMDAMLALALTLHIDPIFVGAHHLARMVFVTLGTPGIAHLLDRPQEDVDD